MVNFAVIGIGRMGNVHANNLIKHRVKGARLVAVCDIDEQKLSAFRVKNFKIPCYTSYVEMAEKEKIDAVMIATEHYAHAEIASFFLEKGINTLVEKPVTVSVSEAEKLNKIAEAHPEAFFGIMYNQRTNRMYRKAKELIESGAIGDIQRVNFIITNWYRSQAYYNQGGWRASWSGERGGTLINQCVHQLDIMQWLVGMPKSLRAECRTVNRNITTENDVLAALKFDGFNGVFQASAHELKGTNRLEIAGTKGKIIIGMLKMKYLIFDKSESEVNKDTVTGYGNTGCKRRSLLYGFKIFKDVLFGQQQNILHNFAKAVEKKDKSILISPASEGIKALSLINAVYMSAWTDSEITLPVDGNKYDILLLENIKKELDNKDI